MNQALISRHHRPLTGVKKAHHKNHKTGKVHFRYRLFSYFRADFGGLDAAKTFLKRYDVIPENADPSLDFREYNWALDLDNFKDL